MHTHDYQKTTIPNLEICPECWEERVNFIDDFKAITWEKDGIVYCTPTHLLTEEQKQLIYEQKGKNGYA